MSEVVAVERPFKDTSQELLAENLRYLVKTIVRGNARLKEPELSEETRKEILDIVESASRIVATVLNEVELRIKS